jgi:hypothetical protein
MRAQAEQEQRQNPVAEILARRQAYMQSLNEQRAQRTEQLAAEANDPESDISRKMQALHRGTAFGKMLLDQPNGEELLKSIPAARMPGYSEIAKIEAERYQHEDRQGRMTADDERRAREFEETQRHNRASEDVARQNAQTRADKGASPEDNAPLSDKERKQITELTDKISAYRGRGNLNGQIENLNPQLVREASMSLARLISQGQITEHNLEVLTPDTLASRWAQKKQMILNHPEGADAQEFLGKMISTAQREKKLALNQIRQGQETVLPNYWGLRKRSPKQFDSILRANGLNPEDYDEETGTRDESTTLTRHADASGNKLDKPVSIRTSKARARRIAAEHPDQYRTE